MLLQTDGRHHKRQTSRKGTEIAAQNLPGNGSGGQTEEMVSPAGMFQSLLRAEIYVSVSVTLPVTVTTTWQKPLKGRDLWLMVLGFSP